MLSQQQVVLSTTTNMVEVGVQPQLPPALLEVLRPLRCEYLQAISPPLMKSLRVVLSEILNPYSLESVESAAILQAVHRGTLGLGASQGESGHWFQPPIQHRLSFAKYVIKQIENSNSTAAAMLDGSTTNGGTTKDGGSGALTIADILQEWYSTLSDLSTNHPVIVEPFYRLYDLFEDPGDNQNQSGREVESKHLIPPIKILETEGGAFVSEGTTGLVTWEASIQLAKWLIAIINSPTPPSNSGLSLSQESIKWILELGSGCGLLAIAAVKTFPKLRKYIASDKSPSALEKCKENYIVNFGSLDDNVHYELLDWTEDYEKFKLLVERCTNEFGRGLLLGADIVFDQELIPPMVNLVKTFQEVQTQTAHFGTSLLSCTVRNEETMVELRQVLEKERLENRTVHSWENGFVLECSIIL